MFINDLKAPPTRVRILSSQVVSASGSGTSLDVVPGLRLWTLVSWDLGPSSFFTSSGSSIVGAGASAAVFLFEIAEASMGAT